MLNSEETGRVAGVARALDRRRDGIVDVYLRRLGVLGSPLVCDARSRVQVRRQAFAVLEDTARVLSSTRDGSSPVQGEISDEIGESRAASSVHPSESLRAVEALCAATLEVIVEELLPSPTSRIEVAALALAVHRSAMERVTAASVAYVDYLLRKVHDAHLEERSRIAKDLKQQAGHLMAVVCRGLELHELESGASGAGAEGLAMARRAARTALWHVDELSEELRRSYGGSQLEVAVWDVLRDNVPDGTRCWIATCGDGSRVPPHLREEMLILLGEAVRYAAGARRADRALPSEMNLQLRVEPASLWVALNVDAPVLRPLGEASALDSMRERVSLLGGEVGTEPAPGGGLRLWLELPLARREAGEDVGADAVREEGLHILLADRHTLYRDSLARVLRADPRGSLLVDEADGDVDLAEATRINRPDILLLDAETPNGGLEDTIRRVLAASPTTRVAVMGLIDNPYEAIGVLGCGASAYVAKGATAESTLACVRAAARGESGIVLPVLAGGTPSTKSAFGECLSDREREVLALVACGAKNKQIAASLHISLSTVKRHLANVNRKLGVHTRKEAVAKALL